MLPLFFEKDSSAALDRASAGFLGLLHLDVVQERLEREYDFPSFFPYQCALSLHA